MWLYILQGIGFGFAAAVQPGPLQTYLISQTLLKGWRRMLSAALAPLVSDGPIIALCLFVLSRVPAWLERFLYLAGGLYVLFLAFGAYRSWQEYETSHPSPGSVSGQSLLRAALMNALSPGPYLFWSLVTGPILLRGWRESPAVGVGFLFGFYAALITSLAAIILVFDLARRLGPRVNRTLLAVSALALVCFGLYQLWLGMTG